MPLLSIITFLPLLGALFILLIREGDDQADSNAKLVALWTALVTLGISIAIPFEYDIGKGGFQLIERMLWVPALDIYYLKGVDGISLWFVLGSTLLTPICILASWQAIKQRVKEFMIALLILETAMIGMFTALDLVLFYLFFEAVLIPMFIMIGVWGGPRRIYASYKFFLYTFVGSVLMLLAVIAMYIDAGTSDMRVLVEYGFAPELQFWMFLAFLASFAVKSPMWPVHTWLPDAHVEAPTAGSVMLAGILLKMGGYGLIRFNVQMMPEAAAFFAPLIFALSVIAIVYTSLVAFVQEDMKKLVAYSSVAHMGFATLGIFTATQQGMEGAIMVMLSHAIVSPALFLLVGVIYDRLHTREIRRYGGLADVMPVYAVIFMLFTLASIGLPGTSGFVGEFLALAGAFQASSWVGVFAALGVILGALYMLNLYRRLFMGRPEKDDVKALSDVNAREIAYFLPLLLIVFWMGIAPGFFQQYFAGTAGAIVERQKAARETLGETRFAFELERFLSGVKQ